ncbi:hypothetical protein INP83_18355 [Mucilaginibacter sp. 21P]|uniref:hypothetical protein n=1 Tax=Mucilaginibacter sp. 21P TaxID=2778902 RepID=UPI001C5774EF|nr:hypothetical protein [Mucilaginibacter sp. 21P]QXV65020.1 hypothetical protein INP83_18355 [Mucilaginibacter sp. 21P]
MAKPSFCPKLFCCQEGNKSKKVNYKYSDRPKITEFMRPSQKAITTGIALAETLKHFAAAASFLFGTFSFAEKEKVHPLTLIIYCRS